MNKNDIQDAKVEYPMSEANRVKMYVSGGFFLLLFLMGLIFLMTSCTLSFQNISTHGVATDLVDEEQTASPKTDANIPISIPATL